MIFFIYQFLLSIIIFFSPFIIIFRILKNKEDKYRFKEKFCFISKKFLDQWKPEIAIFLESLKIKNIDQDLKKSSALAPRKEKMENLSGFMDLVLVKY